VSNPPIERLERPPLPPATSSPAWRRWVAAGLAVVLAAGLLAGGLVWTNTFGVGERFDSLLERIALVVDPPPDRPTLPTVTVTARPSPTATPRPTATLPVTASAAPVDPTATPTPEPTPTPPPRVPVDVDILADPDAVFASEQTNEMCAAAGVQMTLAILGLADTSPEFQHELESRIDEWESWEDSHNGGWGPASMSLALAAYGAPGYEIRGYETRTEGLRGAAVAIAETGAPAILLSWRGAHTWVMTGFRANADPLVFDDASVQGAYILDPWYPRVSSIWGPSDPPGTFQDAAEMERNFLQWQRPEGAYPDRDGRYIVLAPTIPVSR
jgi:hypothetical protein